MHQIHFRPGSAPDSAGGAYDAPRPISAGEGDTASPYLSPSTPSVPIDLGVWNSDPTFYRRFMVILSYTSSGLKSTSVDHTREQMGHSLAGSLQGQRFRSGRAQCSICRGRGGLALAGFNPPLWMRTTSPVVAENFGLGVGFDSADQFQQNHSPLTPI